MKDLLPAVCGIEGPALLPSHVECAFGAVEITADVFASFGAIAGELPVFPGGGETIEIVDSDLVVWSVGGLLRLIKNGFSFDRATPNEEIFRAIFGP
jgi:hypothetical protein